MAPRHLEHGHDPRDIAKRLKQGPRISYLRDITRLGVPFELDPERLEQEQ